MLSATSSYSRSQPSIREYQSTRPLHLAVQDSIMSANNDGVTLLQAGENKTAMIVLARCLAIMRACTIEGEKEIRYEFTNSVKTNFTPLHSSMDKGFIFASPLEIIETNSSSEKEPLSCKLVSLVLFNLSLAHHLHAQELIETIRFEAKNEIKKRKEASALLERSLRLYELCHTSLVFTSSGLVCSDLSIAVIVTNNVGEIHKELGRQQEHNTRSEHNRTAMACSEQLLQIFMFFAANGESDQLEGLGEILTNAMASMNGPNISAPAA